MSDYECTLEEFYSYVWHKKWPDDVLNDPALASRRKRSHSLQMISLDTERGIAVFPSSRKDSQYLATLRNCTCKDFALGHGKRPCKHIFRLAEELGLFKNEYLDASEFDYTTQLHSQGYFSPKIPLELGQKLTEIAEHEGRTLAEQVNIFLEHSVAVAYKDNSVVEATFQITFLDKPEERPSYLPNDAQVVMKMKA